MKKPVLYIIHGWTYTVAPWEKTIALLNKQGIKVEMLHVPGLTSPSQKVWTIDEYVRWADRNIPDGAVALGHSNGGRILLNLCSEKPEKLSHLILLDAAGVYEASGKRDLARSASKAFGFLKKVPGLAKIWHKLTGATDYARAPENMKRTLSNMLESDKKLDFSKIKVPTSILWGAADTVTPPRQAEVMHEKIKGSTLDIHQGWTHAPYISHPAELAKAILRAYKKPPEVAPAAPAPITQAAEMSASMAMKKAEGPVAQNTANLSASMTLKKAAGPVADDATKMSAALAVPSTKKTASKENNSIVASLAGVNYEQANIQPARKMITTASVPKISKIEKMKRAAKRKRNAKKINKARNKSEARTAAAAGKASAKSASSKNTSKTAKPTKVKSA